MARRGRKPKSKEQKDKDAFERTRPADYILERRAMFSFLTPSKGPDGRVGEIDQDVCDAIGQLQALGLLDGHGYDSVELRDKGRFWGGHIARRYKASGCKTGGYERRDRSTPSIATTPDDLLFDRIDENLWMDIGGRYIATTERKALWTLVVDPLIGFNGETVPWAQGLIDEALLQRNRVPKGVTVFPGEQERALLAASIRALCIIAEGSIRPRWERAA